MIDLLPHTVTAPDHLLLRVILADDDTALRAWTEWRERYDLARIEEDGYVLLPQVYRRLQQLDVPESSLLTLKGIYRHTWCHNQAMAARMGSAILNLRRQGIDCLLVSHAALLTTGDCATLPLRKCAFLVPAHQFRRATACFRSAGWSQWSDYDDAQPRLNQYINFTHEDGTTCSIYRSLFGGWDASWGDEDCWLHADAHVLHDTPVRTLCPADQLLMFLLDAGLVDRPPSPRTVADIGTVLREAAERIDWKHLRMKIARLYVTLPIKRAIARLSALSLFTLSPQLSSVAGLDTSWAEDQADRTGDMCDVRGRVARSIARHWCRYGRRARRGSLAGVVAYLRDSRTAQAIRAMPALAMKTLSRHIPESP